MSQSLTTDSLISHYRIVSKIGAGGMGEVYLAPAAVKQASAQDSS